MKRLGTQPSWLTLTAFALGLALAPAASAEEIDGDLRIGVYTDASEAFLGGGILTRLGETSWFLNPNLEYVFVDHGELATLNLDFHYDLISQPEADFWLGAGPALVLRDHDPPGPGRGDGETDFGVNLFAGVGFLRDRAVRPFFQAKLLLSDESEGVIAFGIRFF